jgi:hypothetical protein
MNEVARDQRLRGLATVERRYEQETGCVTSHSKFTHAQKIMASAEASAA